ncbi:MAG: outer membrane protein assembly factor BamA [Pseudomonadales bacterium]|nr:outer membrane protein assembly factor BamA [Pseudomonadales bacterium]HNL32647.1 outer membrane protein assembly factor BamA [Pseudomonadales bacterium]
MKALCKLFVLLGGLTWFCAHAAESAFRVTDIRVDGLKRVSAGTVFSALSVNVGETIDQGRLDQVVHELFETGYFQDISIGREGGVLIIKVVERPAISKIEISGNKAIKTEQLTKAMKGVGLAEGQVFRRAVLDRMTLELKRQYVSEGRYGAEIKSEITEEVRNRVAIQIAIEEGEVAKVRHINIVGNEIFSDKELLKLFEIDTGSLFSFFTKSDQYSREKLSGDLERLRSYYLDRGFIQFEIDSTQVSVSPDKEEVYVSINVREGAEFKVRNVRLAGDLKVLESELRSLITTQSGEVFSRQKMTASADLLRKRLGDDGYTTANVNGNPEVDTKSNQVDIVYYVEPGNLVYVNRISFAGNSKTKDEVLRRELQQMESSLASTRKIENSKSRLERLGFFKKVDVETVPVTGATDKIDLKYTVEEQPSGAVTASVGYGQTSGIVYGIGVQQSNFLGTGNNVSFNVSKSDYQDLYSLKFTDPYFTVDGVSLGYRFFYQTTDFDEFNVAKYSTDAYGAGINFGYPIADTQRLNFGFDVEHTKIKEGVYPEDEIVNYLNEFGDTFDNYLFSLGWRQSTLEGGVLPRRGYATSAVMEVTTPGSTLDYYILRLKSERFFPIRNDWVFHLDGYIGYGDSFNGDGSFPFFKHFYAGGLGSVRGYKDNTLGPKATPNINDPDQSPDAFGGNLLTTLRSEVLFPLPFVDDKASVRSAFFVDAGNVFDTNRDYDFDFAEIRYATGVGLTWVTGLAPLSFSIAKALNPGDGDKTLFFQFSLGYVN